MGGQPLAEALERDHRFAATAVITQQAMRGALDSGAFHVLLLGELLEEHTEEPLEFVQLVQQGRSDHPELSIVVLLESLEKDHVVQAFRSGACGVFSRADSYQSLCKCIASVHAGQIWASSEQLLCVIDALAEIPAMQDHKASKARSLSRREEEIARLAATGLSNRQISQQLELSEHTVKNYLFRIFEKLGVSTRVELTLYALKRPQPASTKSQLPLPSSGEEWYGTS